MRVIFLFQRVEGLETGFAEEQSTIEWLKSHSVEYLKLTLKDMVVKGSVGRYSCL